MKPIGTISNGAMRKFQSNFLLSTFPNVKCCDINPSYLQLFAEGGAPGAAAVATGNGSVGGQSAQAAVADASAKTASVDGAPSGEALSRAAKRQAQAAGEKQTVKNPLASVKYGKEASEPQAAAVEPPALQGGELPKEPSAKGAQDKTAAFEALIRGEYKEQFAARTQNIIDQRFKQTKQLEAKSQKADTLMGRLAKRYGVNANDLDAIVSAAEQDESYMEKEAMSRGLSVDEMRRVKHLESENAQLRSNAQQRSASDAAQRLYRTWLGDGEQLKTVYPEFNFQNELKNSAFTKLIKSGVPLRTAYETSHLEQILGGAMQYTADKVAEGMAARIADRSARPAENGTTPHAGAVVKTDVASLSRADREEIERRVMRGEKILF